MLRVCSTCKGALAIDKNGTIKREVDYYNGKQVSTLSRGSVATYV